MRVAGGEERCGDWRTASDDQAVEQLYVHLFDTMVFSVNGCRQSTFPAPD